jgi:hypothetical protein
VVKFEDNPILQEIVKLFEQQQEKGLKKYGTLVKLDDYSIIGWIEHEQQELIDALVYLECIKQRIQDDMKKPLD